MAIGSALALCVGGAAVAADQVMTIDIGYGMDRSATVTNFAGPVERLNLKAVASEVYCDSINVTLTDGRTRQIYSGSLAGDMPISVEMPLDQQNVDSVDFLCRSDYGVGAVEISSDLVPIREAWAIEPAPPPIGTTTTTTMMRASSSWVPLGHERFTGSHDQEIEEVNIATHEVSTIGLKPTDNDAQCTRINAHFANGTTQTLELSGDERLSEDMIYRVNLPVPQRDLTQVDMECSALGDDDVTIEVYASNTYD
jgi:hypothetical protein